MTPALPVSPAAAPHRARGIRARRALAVLGLACAAALLTACGSAPRRDGPVAEAPAPAGTPGRSPARRGGGYYKDDGPEDAIPDNLDAIPDAEPRDEPLHRFANRPYHVMGQSFVPATAVRSFRQRGHGSWYGRRFHGKPTSSGEAYDMYAMTAAHPTLPIPSYARVTNLGNGRSVVVRVNDRGPFLRGRVIDLSAAAAHRLGYIDAGSAPVEVELIGTAATPEGQEALQALTNGPAAGPMAGPAIASGDRLELPPVRVSAAPLVRGDAVRDGAARDGAARDGAARAEPVRLDALHAEPVSLEPVRG